jgi:hypothetical protein
MPGMMGKAFGALGSMGPLAGRSKAHVLGAGLKPAQQAARRAKYGLPARAASKTQVADAMAKRQMQVGRRIAAGGIAAMGASTIGSGKKDYYNPMPTAKGTGRYS